MGKVTGLAHIGIKIKDLAVSKDFYMNKLGFVQDDENHLDGGMVLCFLSKGNCLLELICPPVAQELGGKPIVDHVCMEVEDIDSLVAELKEKGIEFEGEVSYSPVIRGGIKNVFLKGPDGERIEFFDYLKK